MTSLAEWQNFYVIVGSSAGALIGLQFVVITLIADAPVAGADTQASGAFATPSVVHFGAVLFLSAILSAPWKGLGTVTILWGLMGFGGIVYSLIVARRMRAQKVYQPVFEDWLFYLLLPLAAYAAQGASACVAHSHERPALFLLAGAALLLLFIGIHNAWDAVIYHVFVKRREKRNSESSARSND
jgi:hypothetical protein